MNIPHHKSKRYGHKISITHHGLSVQSRHGVPGGNRLFSWSLLKMTRKSPLPVKEGWAHVTRWYNSASFKVQLKQYLSLEQRERETDALRVYFSHSVALGVTLAGHALLFVNAPQHMFILIVCLRATTSCLGTALCWRKGVLRALFSKGCVVTVLSLLCASGALPPSANCQPCN